MFGQAAVGGTVTQASFRRGLVLALLASGSVTCSFPTDKSDQVIVLIESPSAIVIRGEQMPLGARAFRVSGADTVEIPNTSFAWATGDASLATVQPAGGHEADVTGVNSGTVQIQARAVAYERAEAGQLQLRVSNPLEVDSVRPSSVRFGDTLTVYGVGVDSIFIASVENTTLLDYPIPFLLPTRTRDAQGFGTATFWVPPPARSGHLAYIAPGVFGEAPETTFVQPVDAHEPNDTTPYQVDLDVSPPPFPAVPVLRFYNPALAFEALPRDVSVGIDWYRFSQTVQRDLTLVIGGSDVRGAFETFITDSLAFTGADFVIGPTSWTVGPQSNACAGFAFAPEQQPAESTIVALRGLPPGVLHSLSVYTQPGHYGLRVQEGYLVTNPLIPRDEHEEDDFCSAEQAAVSVTSVSTGAAAWRDTLTIDNPHDVDWIRFRVSAGPSGLSTTIKVAALVAGVDSSDIDLYILTVPGGGARASLTEIRRSVNSGSSESISVSLAQGDHYAVVADYAGRPVHYAVCIQPVGILPACNAFPAPPAGEGVRRRASDGTSPAAPRAPRSERARD
jgi:hypothetical protein